ncbi:uncharacterized protein LOC130961311 [Arachis stenosperma]|uniref:uncharacterized protein LOC130961311 n=1 Tax=Arachis stenosperma TaxID=217475 RepID=UPI0025AC1D0E|nr:uncharacterized protein LOC130961311 [Arachis stenosperma]XP_057743107.1 uncharacterized protein LOC130961311 [Arachis stenosperma]
MPEVLEISSDEEQGPEKRLKSVDYDWIREFLGMSDSDSDDDGKSDDSDDVIIIRENKPHQPKSKSSTVAVKNLLDDEDGDCVVLDGDPENGVTCLDDEPTGSDELLVVGEKGQVACRDYPHARHACAKFPFSSTPHETHCDQCHCYVCDSLAPCLMWGTGLHILDHCHANDKTELWKNQRKNFKLGNFSPLPALTNHGTSLRAGHRECNEILPPEVIHLPPDSILRNQARRSTAVHSYSLNSVPQNNISRPARLVAHSPALNSRVQNQLPIPNNIPVYSKAPNISIPNGRSYRGAFVRNRPQPLFFPKHCLGVRTHAIHRERGSGVSGLSHQFLHPLPAPNRVATAANFPTVNHSGHVSSSLSNHVSSTQLQGDEYHTAPGFSNQSNVNDPNRVWLPGNSLLSPNSRSHPQTYSQPFIQSNEGNNFYEPYIQDGDSPLSYSAPSNSNQHQNEHQMRNQNENAVGNIVPCEIESQETYQSNQQEVNQREAFGNADNISAFESSWCKNTGQSVEPSIACSHLQDSGSSNQVQPPNVSESDTHVTPTGNVEPPTECSSLPDSFVDIENWLFDKDSVPRLSDNGSLPSELINIPSPEWWREC